MIRKEYIFKLTIFCIPLLRIILWTQRLAQRCCVGIVEWLMVDAFEPPFFTEKLLILEWMLLLWQPMIELLLLLLLEY